MSSKSWAGTREAFAQSAAWFVRTCVEVHGKWDQFGLGELTVRDLVGHTSRALLTVETYLDQETAAVEVTSPVEYFHLVLSSTGDPAAVAQRGRDAGAALGSDAAEAVAGIADRVLARVSAAEGTALSRRPSVACV